MKPNPNPKHEAKESKSEEKFEHASGMEVQDEKGRKMYNQAKAHKKFVKKMMRAK